MATIQCRAEVNALTVPQSCLVRNIFLSVMFILLTSQAVLAAPYSHNATGLIFPDRLATLEKEHEATDYSAEDPGLGISLGYNGPGIIVTIYIYTMGQKNIPDDLQSPVLKEQFRKTVNDIVNAAKAGAYSNLEKISEGEAAWGASGSKMKSLQASFSLQRNEGAAFSQLHLLGYKNHFLKIRITYLKEAQESAEETLKEFFNKFSELFAGRDTKKNSV